MTASDLTSKLLKAARDKNCLIACAESCTGGMLASELTRLPGSSAMFDRGFVTYTNDAKTALLGVGASTLDKWGAVSEQVAAEMADGALGRSGAGVAVAITGIAGPGGSQHKPEGRVCFGLADGSQTCTETVEFGALGRDQVRLAARNHALAMLYDCLCKLTQN